jgi:hypothetical protein
MLADRAQTMTRYPPPVPWGTLIVTVLTVTTGVLIIPAVEARLCPNPS